MVARFVWDQSCLSNEEHGELVATFKATFDDTFKCEVCLSKFADDEDGRRRSLFRRTHQLGCYGGDGKKTFVKFFGLAFQTCPGNYFSQEARGWIELWRIWNSKSVLPYPGSILEQPAKLTEIFATLTALEDYRRQEENRETELLKGPTDG